ncbi:lysophospholipid acyltransferase LPEAT2 isoform X1 [Brassica rapa]|uniref:EF-hand domain-containing protein n=1 Tax=Brassica campestris TaxID=3711 RepID=M4C866_BRACM|nr:lysophospholipid acyltransferase LPEAT2 isoform X1 [Brassica rapa]
MANPDLSSPLITSDQPEVFISIDDDDGDDNHPRGFEFDHLNPINPFGFLTDAEPPVQSPTTVDPFRNDTPGVCGLYEAVKIVICLPIALVRLVLFGVSLAVGYLATKLALAGWRDRHNPMPQWRCRVMWVTRFCTRCILFSFGYQWIRRKGKPARREIAPIIVSNHVSYIEPIFYFYELSPTIVASESHDSLPLVGTIIRAMQVIYVNRFSQASRKDAVGEIKRKASCDRFPRLLLFPEGTTTNGKAVISFQLGAFIPGYPIQPLVVRYPHVHFDQSWGNISLVMLMFRMFTQFHNFMEVEYLPVIYPNDNHKQNAVRLSQKTSHAIATSLNVVQTSHSYGDLMLLNKASELKLENPSNYMVEMAKVESLFHVSNSEAVRYLETFSSMNPDSSGRVTLHDFLRVLKLKPCTLSEEIFEFIDVEKVGSITFRQFLFASAHVSTQPLFQQTCELSFSHCDADGDGYISIQELGDALKPTIPNLNKVEIQGMFMFLDDDKDQRISKNDFLSCLRRNPLLIAMFSPILATT